MKIALPDNAKIAKEAKECMQECVSEYISFITSEGKIVQIVNDQVLLLTSFQQQRSVSMRSARLSMARTSCSR